MKNKYLRWGCLLGTLLIFCLLAAAAGWWFYSTKYQTFALQPSPSVSVFLLSPSNGDDIEAGNIVPVKVQIVALDAIHSAQLFVDGKPLGSVTDSPETAFWSWQAWPAGIHTLNAQATASDGTGYHSQTVIVNVLDATSTVQIPAKEGQTLDNIGSEFGLPADQIASANPKIDPAKPLQEGFPVKVPVTKDNSGKNGAENEPEQTGKETPFPLITWQFTPLEPVDKSYCYTSTADGNWKKMPKQPFKFFSGSLSTYIQDEVVLKGNEIIVQMQCWGWMGGTLKYLGQGETKFDAGQPPYELVVNGKGFQLIGKAQAMGKSDESKGGVIKTIPPPFAMREPVDTADCAKHNGNILAGFICDKLLNASVKQYRVLQWEWQPKMNWPGYETWHNEIIGYHIFEIDPVTKSEKHLVDVSNPGQKAIAVPLPWGAPCYGVRAFSADPAFESSDISTYCPGQAPATEKATLSPITWHTTGGQWVDDGDCDSYGGADYFTSAQINHNGFGKKPGEVLVGSYIVDDDDADCYREGYYTAGVKFLLQLPPDAVVQQAVLKFSKVFMDYGATGLAAPKPVSCVASVAKAKQDWGGLINPDHFTSSNILNGYAYNPPLVSLPAYITPQADVTAAVNDWVKHPANNHGFILFPVGAPHPLEDGSGSCISGLGSFQLEVSYFAPAGN